jgi:LAO/AO transport system kinase
VSVDALADAILKRDRAALGRVITLLESTREADQETGEGVLAALMPHTGGSHRIGITGAPGVGKSTLIDALGSQLTSEGHRVAVLAVDPSSRVSGGSILGDKTRMNRLSRDPNAFVRPSPSSGTLGGVARRTREVALLCEAAGHDVVLVETVGTGQSEATVARLVDSFVVLLLPGAGDELQGIKRGVLELADVLVVNKADGDRVTLARLSATQYRGAISYLRPLNPLWTPPVLCASATTGDGLPELWESLVKHKAVQAESGAFDTRRQRQRVEWMWDTVEAQLRDQVRTHPGVAAILSGAEHDVESGARTPSAGARQILEAFHTPPEEKPQ